MLQVIKLGLQKKYISCFKKRVSHICMYVCIAEVIMLHIDLLSIEKKLKTTLINDTKRASANIINIVYTIAITRKVI